RESIHNYPRAVEIYKSLREVFPDNPDYALGLVTMQTLAGNPKEALASLDQLRSTFPALKDDPRIDATEASAADRLSDFKREQAPAQRASASATARGDRLLAARALLMEGWAWRNLGDQAKAIAVSLEAKTIYEAVGDRVGESRALHNLANIAEGLGKNEE